MVSGGGDFRLRSLQHLLIPAVNQLGDFAVDEVSGISEYLDALVAVFLDRSRHVVLLEEHASLRARRFDQIEAVVAEPLYGVFESSLFYFGCHVNPVVDLRSLVVGQSYNFIGCDSLFVALYPMHCSQNDDLTAVACP